MEKYVAMTVRLECSCCSANSTAVQHLSYQPHLSFCRPFSTPARMPTVPRVFVRREYCMACVCWPTRHQRSCGYGKGHGEVIAVTHNAWAVRREQFAVTPGMAPWPGPHITAAVTGPPFVRVSTSTSCGRAHVQRNTSTPSRCGMRTSCWQPPSSSPQHSCCMGRH